MMSVRESLSFTYDPVWPWSLAVGLPALCLIAILLVILTHWTYKGVQRANRGRVWLLTALRILALALACLILLRPAVTSQADPRLPSTLLFLVDGSESMTIQDEIDGKPRWEYLQRIFRNADSALRELQEDHQVAIVMYRFAEQLGEYSAEAKSDGKRTDFAQALQELHARHGRERNLRGLLVFSDGADNGTRFPPDQSVVEAARWRNLPCPVHAFGLGKTTTAERERDLAFTDIVPAPAPVPIKSKLTVKGFLDAPGFENVRAKVRLLIDDKEVLVKEETLQKTVRNEISLVTDAPAERPKDGEIKVTLQVDPIEGELTPVNNEMSTYVTVTKEGISVLLVDQPRFPEPQIICDALAADPRIRLFPAWLRSDEIGPDLINLFQFDKQHYDAIIVGDLTARRLSGGNPAVLEKIRELVRDRGTGLLMMGGWNSFGNSDWRGTPIGEMLPVELDARGQVEGPVKVEPTPAGIGRYLMRLTEKPEDNIAVWNRLPELNGMTRLGREKGGALVLATRAGTREPVLVSQDFGKGRTLAFAGDTTWRWQLLGQPQSSEGVEIHARFWRQVVLWLAKQDETEGTVWVKPERRRLDAGEKLGFTVGLRGKGGIDAPEAHFEVSVVDPKGIESPLSTARDEKGERGTFWKTDQAGEYRLVVRGRGKDVDGQPIPEGTAMARFVVFESNTEMTRRAADHAFLARLAQAGGGSLHKAEELAPFLKELPQTLLPQGKTKWEAWPDWRRTSLTAFRVGLFLAFAGVLCLEWFLRRYWGLV
jgi:uncharacterized membrane protein